MKQQQEWVLIANEVIQRDNFTCQNCGAETNLLVHHKIPRRLGGLDTPDNLVTLCKICHPKVERKAQEYKHPERCIDIHKYETVIRKLGNSGYVAVPKALIGREVRVTVLEESKE